MGDLRVLRGSVHSLSHVQRMNHSLEFVSANVILINKPLLIKPNPVA